MPLIYPARKILVRFPNWVGDVVMATPVLQCLRENYPHAVIDIQLKARLRQIIEDLPWIDDILEFDKKGIHRGIGGHMKMVKELRNREYELALILPNSFSSALMMKMASIPRRVGYRREGRGWLLSDPISPERDGLRFRPTPMTLYYLRLCQHIGCAVSSIGLTLVVSPSIQEQADALLRRYHVDPQGQIIALNPGASFGSSKLWCIERFSSLAEILTRRYDYSVIVLAGPEEDGIAREVAGTKERVVALPSDEVPLDILKGIIQRTSLLITNDTGTRHYAVALRRPVIVIMGPTDPRYTGTNLEMSTVLREDVDCGPCHLKVCPTDLKCMTAISVERVLESVEQILGEGPSRS